MTAPATVNERMNEVVISTLSSPELEQRGRKRRRDPPTFLTVVERQLPSGDDTFRGRSRHRSTSRIDMSNNSSRLRDASLSPTRRKILRIAQLINRRHRSQSPSRSRSPNTQETSKRRRQRTRSHGRVHHDHPKPIEHTSLLCHEIIVRTEPVIDQQVG
ncbi:hypothetical protein BKA67DRAFT_529861 [Truncatella angustata]|uniref:Uncharacterized protein n=1 Tax=Truncatella angustata TaxID=152316 RepID=A0A9P9A4B0_9PEZI|nr:uncharacterized protein BKA67DRAFT_529861 [Truncatella angustata]KAH6659719.1 hypothetical protein BKA67DRAFT_529861 [Truncatella angustata]